MILKVKCHCSSWGRKVEAFGVKVEYVSKGVEKV